MFKKRKITLELGLMQLILQRKWEPIFSFFIPSINIQERKLINANAQLIPTVIIEIKINLSIN